MKLRPDSTVDSQILGEHYLGGASSRTEKYWSSLLLS